MLELKKVAISLEAQELMELERIMIDSDEKAAFLYLKKIVYDRIIKSQKGKLKSHLDSGNNPVDGFTADNKSF